VSTVDHDALSDAELIDSVRGGQIASYGTLYERHVGAAYNLARQLARSSTEADDLVSEAFAKLLDRLRAGKGPDSAFRAYLLTALRHTAYDKTRKDRRLDLNEDMAHVGGSARDALTTPFADTAVAGLERTLAAKAFARLPERWQAVLWHTEIEQQTPAQVAPLLGLTANGVSALAYRAREGLRQAYLQVHLAETGAERCHAAADKLGAWTRDGLSKRERAQVETHLDECERCRVLALELADINGGLRAAVAPLVLGGAVVAYLASAGAAKVSAAGTGVAAAGAGTAGSGGGGASAGGAATEGPRQFLAVAASGVAMAAAVAIGLAAGGGGQAVPAAVQPVAEAPAHPAEPVPAQSPATTPPQRPFVPPAPPAPQPSPRPQPVVPPEVPSVSAPGPTPEPTPEPTPVPPPPPPAPEPAPAQLSARGPAEGVALVAGGAADLPVTVRNDGGRASDPVSATLNLPDGVTVTEPAAGGGSPAAGARTGDRPRAQADGPSPVRCPASQGTTASCASATGLAPGESAVLLFRLTAGPDARSGTVTGTVSAGAAVQVAVAIDVQVAPAPQQDSVEVRAWTGAGLHVRVGNTGESSEPVTVTVDAPVREFGLGGIELTCGNDGSTTTCTSVDPLEPGDRLWAWFVPDLFSSALAGHHRSGDTDRHGAVSRDVTVTAILGSARDSATVDWPWWPLRPGTTTPSSTSASSTEPSTAEPTGTTGKPTTTTGVPGGTETPGSTETPSGSGTETSSGTSGPSEPTGSGEPPQQTSTAGSGPAGGSTPTTVSPATTPAFANIRHGE